MLNTVPVPVIASLIGGSPEEVFQQAVVTVEPSHHVAQEDLVWWLGLQERLEIRADLTQAGLLCVWRGDSRLVAAPRAPRPR